ncbi:GDSL-type esterase/lipase family protein [Sphingomonas sp. ID0503]|uniref:GDSL-type esterase/lipase family protein n=1 Tax=Sphingomonas sp. ID0503 TaxID=3399691 RepID=UPI003AFA607E
MIRRIAALLLSLSAGAAVAAPPPVLNFDRFSAEIAAFAARDAARQTPGRTLFVGSSSIRLWDTDTSFPSRRAINRGFGGATTPDVLHFYPEVVKRYHADAVIVYVGENDIAAGTAPDQVAQDVLTLLGKIREDNPKARIVYLSMKPSPSRFELWPQMAAANNMIRAKATDFDFLDVGSALVGANGRPDPQYYSRDGLHMNQAGYKKWTTIVDAYLGAMPGPTQPRTTTAASGAAPKS